MLFPLLYWSHVQRPPKGHFFSSSYITKIELDRFKATATEEGEKNTCCFSKKLKFDKIW